MGLGISKISIVRWMTYRLTTSSPGALGAGQSSWERSLARKSRGPRYELVAVTPSQRPLLRHRSSRKYLERTSWTWSNKCLHGAGSDEPTSKFGRKWLSVSTSKLSEANFRRWISIRDVAIPSDAWNGLPCTIMSQHETNTNFKGQQTNPKPNHGTCVSH